MFIHPSNSKTTITNLDEQCNQSNAVDLRIGKLFKRTSESRYAKIYINETLHGEFEEVRLIAGGWWLAPNQFYQFETIHHVEIGENEMGWLIARSSLVRNGLTVNSGVYDAGFRGIVGGVIHNPTQQSVWIDFEARIAQFVLTQAQSIKKYDGQYQDKGVVK